LAHIAQAQLRPQTSAAWKLFPASAALSHGERLRSLAIKSI
jgi:hypothetical protein